MRFLILLERTLSPFSDNAEAHELAKEAIHKIIHYLTLATINLLRGAEIFCETFVLLFTLIKANLELWNCKH